MQERAKMKKYLFLLAGSPGTGKNLFDGTTLRTVSNDVSSYLR